MQSNHQVNPEELLSAAFDGEFGGALDISDDRRSELDQEWAALREEIRSFPVGDVDLVTAVRAEVGRAQRMAPAEQRQSWYTRNARLTAVTTIVVVLLFVSVSLVRHGGLGFGPANNQLLQDAVVWLDEHPDPTGYNFVVVDIAEDASVKETVREMLGAAEVQVAEFTSLYSADEERAEYSAGFLLTAGHESQVILDSLADRQENLDWNPVDIHGRSHDEIKEMFLASMKMPTKSDKVFGAMFVVDAANRGALQKELPVVAPDAADVIAANELEDAESPGADEGLDLKPIVPSPLPAAAAPLIVIFRKRDSASGPVPGAEQGMLSEPVLAEPAV